MAHHIGWLHTLVHGSGLLGVSWLLGPLLGVGVIAGDALKSFFKRQRGVPSGHTWVPFDQIDYAVGAILVSLPFIRLSIGVYVWMLIIMVAMTLVSSYIGWLFGLKEAPI
jgi:CDP-2,3-bis-(O-geranylgeranyl)-sn-glycerol synthase